MGSLRFDMQIINDESFPFKFTFLPKVDRVSNLFPGDSHVVEKLSFLFRAKLFERLSLNYNFAEHQ